MNLLRNAREKALRELLASDPLVRRAALKRLAWRVPGRGLVYFIYSYFWRRGFLDGRDGFVLCLMRSVYQSMVAIKKYDKRRMAGVGWDHSSIATPDGLRRFSCAIRRNRSELRGRLVMVASHCSISILPTAFRSPVFGFSPFDTSRANVRVCTPRSFSFTIDMSHL